MSRLLVRSAIRQALRHPWQTGLTVIGVAVAVAVVTGIDLTHASSLKAFDLSVEGVAGRAGHEIVGGPQGLDESVYADLRASGRPFARDLAPVIEGRARLGSADERGETVRILGIDPFAEAGIRPFTAALFGRSEGGSEGGSPADVTDFLLHPDAVAVGRPLAERLGLGIGDPLPLTVAGVEHRLRIHSILEPGDALERRSLDELLVCDLATAQELLARPGRIDRVDVVAGDEPPAALVAALPQGARVQSKESRSRALEEMTRAFRLNLQALSLLALLVGVFLVYNTLTFSVLQRRSLFGRLRAMGVHRREILGMVLAEALLIGALGTALGLALGTLAAGTLLRLVIQTVNDLYFAVTVQQVTFSASSWIKALGLGLAGPLLAAIPPAREAGSTPATDVLRRSSAERRMEVLIPLWNRGGLVLVAVAGVLLALPSRSVGLAFSAVFFFIVGFCAWVPGFIRTASRRRPTWILRGLLERLAVRDLERSLSRTGIAALAFVLALATTLGIGIMVTSFRETLKGWLDTTLQADLYVSSKRQDARGHGPAIDPERIEAARSVDGVEQVTTYRRVEVGSDRGTTQLHALGMERRGFNVFRFARGSPERVWPAFRAGEGVLVSEPYAYRHRVGPGDSLELWTDAGPRPFPVLGVFYDYASDRGIAMIHREAYLEHWNDPAVQSLGIYLESGRDPEQIGEIVRQRLEGADLRVSPSAELRRVSLEIFDRTFEITAILRLLAIGVAFVGLVSALMALQLEKGRELATLRALGAVPGQVFRLVMTQTAALGLLAGLASLPLGWILSAMLIHVINKRSFGWSLEMTTPWRLPVETLILALAASLAAGLYPAWKASRARPSAALREE